MILKIEKALKSEQCIIKIKYTAIIFCFYSNTFKKCHHESHHVLQFLKDFLVILLRILLNKSF